MTAASTPPSFVDRLRLGVQAGLLGGAAVGLVEALVILSQSGSTRFGVLAYATVLYGLIGAGMGVGGALPGFVVAKDRAGAWCLSLVAAFAPLGFVISVFLLRREVYAEQMPPTSVLGMVGIGFLVFAGLVWFVFRPLLQRTVLGKLTEAGPGFGAYGLLLAVMALVGLTSRALPDGAVDRSIENPRLDLEQAGPILLIMVDTLRWDHVGIANEIEIETPAMDMIAEEGIIYEQGYAQASWTRASIASLITSMYPSGHQAFRKADRLSDDVITLSEQLSELGYFTAARANNINVTQARNFDQGYDDFEYLRPSYPFGADQISFQLTMYNVLRMVKERFFSEHKEVDLYYWSAERVVDELTGFYEEHGSDRTFMFAHFMDPHDPYFRHPFDGWGYARVDNPNPDPADAEMLLEVYKGEVEWMDGHMMGFFQWLKEEGIWDELTIVLTSDHGEEFHEHGGWWHGITLNDEQVHVPLLVKWSRNHTERWEEEARNQALREVQEAFDAAVALSESDPDAPAPEPVDLENLEVPTPWLGRSSDLVQLIDVAPTLIEIMGGESPASWRGASLRAPYGDRLEGQKRAFAEEDFEGNQLQAIRDADYAYLTANEGNPRGNPTEAFYDRRDDIREQNNLLEGEDQMARVAANGYQRILEGAARAAALGAVDREQDTVSQADCEAMRALGYVTGDTNCGE